MENQLSAMHHNDNSIGNKEPSEWYKSKEKNSQKRGNPDEALGEME